MRSSLKFVTDLLTAAVWEISGFQWSCLKKEERKKCLTCQKSNQSFSKSFDCSGSRSGLKPRAAAAVLEEIQTNAEPSSCLKPGINLCSVCPVWQEAYTLIKTHMIYERTAFTWFTGIIKCILFGRNRKKVNNVLLESAFHPQIASHSQLEVILFYQTHCKPPTKRSTNYSCGLSAKTSDKKCSHMTLRQLM